MIYLKTIWKYIDIKDILDCLAVIMEGSQWEFISFAITQTAFYPKIIDLLKSQAFVSPEGINEPNVSSKDI